MMSKFHKTSYSRGGNFNAVNSSHGRRNPTSFGQSEWMGMKSEQPLQRKIEIQSSLLLNHKNYQRQSVNPPETMTRKVTNRSEVKLYETTTGFTNPRERPQSKQQPRLKSGIQQGKLKTEAFHPQRPQTSKGVRPCRGNTAEGRQGQYGQGQDWLPFQVKITDMKARNIHSSNPRRSSAHNQSNVVAFNTSIDPEFLSLFAN